MDLPATWKCWHLKGFTSGLEVDRKYWQRAKEYILLECKELVWDGDLIGAEDSFTCLISELHESNAELKFTCFIRTCEPPSHAEALLAKLSKLNLKYTQQVDYVEHGLEALRVTEATKCLVIGVGPCVEMEIARAPPNVHFYVLALPRTTGRYILYDQVPSNVTLLTM